MGNGKVNLDFGSFFSHYLVYPCYFKSTLSDRVKSVIGTIFTVFLTLGSSHFYTLFSHRHVLQLKKDCYELKMDNFSKLEKTAGKVNFYFHNCTECHNECNHNSQAPNHCRICQELNTGSLTRENIGQMIQSNFIEPFYSKNKPPKEKVEVPVPTDWKSENKWDHITRVFWKDLTTKQKIEVIDHYALSHNTVPKWARRIPERILGFLVDLAFLWNGSSGVKQDPRTSHGSDHATRAAIWAAIFAYMYGKYHPAHTVSKQEALIAQFAAAGHDCSRQTESVDVFDEWSAEETMKPLKDKIRTSIRFQKEAFEAIAHKDAPPTASKSIIAKCVQNADCAEYARLLLNAPMQTPDSFNNSRTHLDVWKEMNEYAQQKMRPDQTIEEVKLKNGFTFKDFAFELDAIRIEMNHFIHKTRVKNKRERFAQAPSYYDALLSEIKPKKFPLLYSILSSI
jgi:hypothetical protein